MAPWLQVVSEDITFWHAPGFKGSGAPEKPMEVESGIRWIQWISMDDGRSVGKILRAVCHHCHVSREHICATDNIIVMLYNLVLLRLGLSEATQNLHNR